MVGEHTERLPVVPVGEHCAGLKGVGEKAAVKGNRATRLKLCGGSLGQPLVHIQQAELIITATHTTHTGRVCAAPVCVCMQASPCVFSCGWHCCSFCWLKL